METPRSILVPLHFRQGQPPELAADSKEAQTIAVDLARRFDASVTFTHVFVGREDAASDDGDLPQIHAFLAQLVNEVQSAGGRAKWLFLFGQPWREILDLARTEGHDLVVLGTRQQLGQGPLIGSTAAAILAHAREPIWIAKKGEQPSGAVVVATDLTPGSADVLRYGVELANRLQADLHVVHAHDAHGEKAETESALRVRRAQIERAMADIAHDLPLPAYVSHVEAGQPGQVIWTVARQEHASVVVVGRTRGDALNPLLTEHTSEQLLGGLPASLLVLPV